MGGMTRSYVLQRLLMWFLTIWIGVTLTFAIPRLGKSDPTTAMVLRMMNMTRLCGKCRQNHRNLQAKFWP